MKKIKGYVRITLALFFITMLLSGCSQPSITASDNTPLPTAPAARWKFPRK